MVPAVNDKALAAGIAALCLMTLFALYRLSFIVTFPDEQLGLDASAYGVGVTVHELLGRPGGTDLVVDYAAARAMTHGGNAYATAGPLIKAVGVDYPFGAADTHPPSMLSIVLPLTLLKFNHVEQFFAFAMVLAYIATIAMAGVRWPLAIAGGIAIAASMPGAYGLNNPVPIVGLGVALVWRFRDRPLLAGLGIAAAAAPKSSGLILLLPLVLSGRLKATAWGVGFTAVLAAIPMAFQLNVWQRYLKAGVDALAVVEARPDNGAILHLAQVHGVSAVLVGAGIVGAALVSAWVSRDTFWPTVWLMVALLPIAWTYSLLTLLPIGTNILSRRPVPRTSAAMLVVAAGLTLGTRPAYEWPTIVIPIVVVLAYIAILAAPVLKSDFSIDLVQPWLSKMPVLQRQRLTGAGLGPGAATVTIPKAQGLYSWKGVPPRSGHTTSP